MTHFGLRTPEVVKFKKKTYQKSKHRLTSKTAQ